MRNKSKEAVQKLLERLQSESLSEVYNDLCEHMTHLFETTLQGRIKEGAEKARNDAEAIATKWGSKV